MLMINLIYKVNSTLMHLIERIINNCPNSYNTFKYNYQKLYKNKILVQNSINTLYNEIQQIETENRELVFTELIKMGSNKELDRLSERVVNNLFLSKLNRNLKDIERIKLEINGVTDLIEEYERVKNDIEEKISNEIRNFKTKMAILTRIIDPAPTLNSIKQCVELIVLKFNERIDN